MEALKNIKKQQEKIDRFSNALDELCDGYAVFDADNLFLKSLCDVLAEAMGDECDYIDWWLWEEVEKVVYMEDGKAVDVTTPEKLYDFLIENKKEA